VHGSEDERDGDEAAAQQRAAAHARLLMRLLRGGAPRWLPQGASCYGVP
jgi:hypothetical protein